MLVIFFMGAIDAADVMGWADQIGAIEPGKFADMIAVDESPLADIKQLKHVRFVMKRRGCCAQRLRQIDGHEGQSTRPFSVNGATIKTADLSTSRISRETESCRDG